MTKWTKKLKLKVLSHAIEGKKWHIYQLESKHFRFPDRIKEAKQEYDWLRKLQAELK